VNIETFQLSQHVAGLGGSKCRLCGERLEYTFVDLGMSPLRESLLLAREQLDSMEAYFPLHVLVCEHYFLVQLREYVRPEQIFREYAYFSSYSTTWVEHAKTYCAMIKERLAPTPVRCHRSELLDLGDR
jgi:Putative zinc binding domain